MRKVLFMGLSICFAAGGCSSGPARSSPTFDQAVAAAGTDAIVLAGEGGSKVLVSPKLQGRIMTTKVGTVESIGFVSLPTIAEGETHAGFNNFGGQDRYWLGPEAGQFGIYFDPGADYDRKVWKVPADFDQGPFQVAEKTADRVKLTRDISTRNYVNTQFKVKADRVVGLISTADAAKALGTAVPAGVAYAGSYSDNGLTNAGAAAWKKETGLVNIWILGQFEPGDRTVIIAPFKPGAGQPYHDEMYFGKVPPDRLKAVGSAMILRADARKEGKIGIPQARTTGFAGSYDFAKNLLVIIRFDVPQEPALYGNSAWIKNQPNPYEGDLFQCYNSDRSGSPDQRYAFYELESVSPSVELAPGQTVRHRQETYAFQGDYAQLKAIAAKVLGVDLDAVKKSMF
jgi:hypothetical protein